MSNDEPEQIPSVDGSKHLPGDFPPPVQDSAYGQPPVPAPGYGPPPVPAPGYGPPPVPAPGYGPPQGYAQPSVQPPGGYATGAPYPVRPTDGVSIAALVTGILSLGLVPIVLGIVGLKRTKANGTNGRGMSIAGIVLGGISLVFWSIVIGVSVWAAIYVDNNADEISTALQSAIADQPTQSEPSEPAEFDESVTPLHEAVPLTVATFTSDGLVVNDALITQGAVEAYTAAFTDASSTVDVVIADWDSPDLALAWATAAKAGFTADQIIDSGDNDGIAYTAFQVGDVVTVVGTNDTLAYTFIGPLAAVDSFYSEFPL